jgi:hypothetical protein
MNLTARVVPAIFVLALALAVAARAQSTTQQIREARGVILGTVTDTGLAPIANAEIEFVRTQLHVTTDARGRFVVTGLPASTYLVAARRLAFQPTVNIAEIAGGDTLRLALMLQPTITTLTPVVVRERSSSAKLSDFDARRLAGVGEFFTQADIERRNPVSVSDLLRQSKTLNISQDGSNPVVAKSRRNVAYNCYIQVYLDGIPLSQPGRPGPDGRLPPADLRNLPSPKELMGIEIYGGAATAPNWLPIGPQVAHSGCGVIMLWTRDGSDDQKPAPNEDSDSSRHGARFRE